MPENPYFFMPRLTLRDKLHRLLWPPAGFARIALPGGSIQMARCDGRDQVLEQALRNGWDDFERPLPRVFRDTLLRSSGLVVDVGANTGFYSLIAARCGHKVLAFEPVPSIRDILHGNIVASRLERRIAIIACAVSDQEGIATLHLPDNRHGLIETSASLNADFQAHTHTIKVLTTVLDELLAPPVKIAVIKIDAEGHEAAVLRGAVQVIAHARPVLFVEVLPRADMTYLNDLLARVDYVDVPLTPDAPLAIAPEVRFRDEAWNHAFLPREQGLAALGGR